MLKLAQEITLTYGHGRVSDSLGWPRWSLRMGGFHGSCSGIPFRIIWSQWCSIKLLPKHRVSEPLGRDRVSLTLPLRGAWGARLSFYQNTGLVTHLAATGCHSPCLSGKSLIEHSARLSFYQLCSSVKIQPHRLPCQELEIFCTFLAVP